MSLADPSAIRDRLSTWRRRSIAGVIVFVLGATAYVQFVGAIRIFLEVRMGPVAGRLFLVACLVVVALIAVAAMWAREMREERDAAKAKSAGLNAVLDAVTLGYSLAQDLKNAVSGEKPRKPRAAAAEKRAKKERRRSARVEADIPTAEAPPL